jgi:hypothetical protein
VGGSVLAAWGCATGIAISFIGYGGSLAAKHPGRWKALEEIGSPISTAVAMVVGHPVLASVYAGNFSEAAPDTNVGTQGSPNPFRRVMEFSLTPGEQAGFNIVSPDVRRAALLASVGLHPVARYAVRIHGPGGASYNYSLLSEFEEKAVEMAVRTHRGVNRFTLSFVPATANNLGATTQLLRFADLSVARAK